MLKFQCERCGERIAVQPRHLNQLVCCPQCGNATHPLAGQILTMHSSTTGGAKASTKAKRRNGSAKTTPPSNPAAQSANGKRPDKKSASPSAPPLEECANCGRPIGRLQKTERWDGKTVCAACAEALSRESLPLAAASIVRVPTPTRVTTAPDAPPPPLGDRMRKAAMDFRNGILWALVAVAVAVGLLYLLLALLRSLGGLVTAAALLVGLLVVGYLCYRAYAAIRRKLSNLGESARSIVKLR